MDSIQNKDKNELYELLDFTDVKKNAILESLLSSNIFYKSIDVSNDVYKDTNIDIWASSLPLLQGSKILIKNIIRNPINDLNILKNRQDTYIDYDFDLSIFKDYEDDVLWIYKLSKDIKENNLIYTLFPSGFLISYINYIEPLLDLYHIYKIYFTPINILLLPLISLFAPLYYLRNILKMNIPISTYLSIIYKVIKIIFSNYGGIKVLLTKIITLGFYIFIIFYNIYQTFEYCYLIYGVRKTLYDRIVNLNIFLTEANKILNNVNFKTIKQFINIEEFDYNIKLNNSMTSVYKLWKDNKIKNIITKILLFIYTIDVIDSINNLIKRKNWCLTDYNTKEVRLWNMKNPILNTKQVGNPIDLFKNIIITGPNAAGKTTYVKSILSNIILSQTFGIANAIRAQILPYDNIVSFMRISDILGEKSYFEVEAEYCNIMMKKALYLSENNLRGLYLMDEPMHSTPPTEGMATAFAVAEYIGNLKGTNIILTTHFHKLTLLEDIYPTKFINISVEAIEKDGKFIFPYTIKKGHSYQCIAIELLNTYENFPLTVIDSAIKMKNKIYTEINSRNVL